jgi:hypothetical protein
MDYDVVSCHKKRFESFPKAYSICEQARDWRVLEILKSIDEWSRYQCSLITF